MHSGWLLGNSHRFQEAKKKQEAPFGFGILKNTKNVCSGIIKKRQKGGKFSPQKNIYKSCTRPRRSIKIVSENRKPIKNRKRRRRRPPVMTTGSRCRTIINELTRNYPPRLSDRDTLSDLKLSFSKTECIIGFYNLPCKALITLL